jgi:membrane protein DedA with SNARE-associated domain
MDPATTTAAAELMSWFGAYGYMVLLLLFIIEGPIIGMTSGVLISLGALRPLPVLLLYTLGLIITDTIVYYVAKSGNTYIKQTTLGRKLLGKAESVISHADSAWKRKFVDNYFSLMILANIIPINLLGTFVAFGAGMLKIPERDFYKPIVISRPLWAAIIIGLGYYLGGAVSEASNMLSQIGVVVAVFGGIWAVYRLFLREKILQTPLGQFLEAS